MQEEEEEAEEEEGSLMQSYCLSGDLGCWQIWMDLPRLLLRLFSWLPRSRTAVSRTPTIKFLGSRLETFERPLIDARSIDQNSSLQN